MMLRNPDKLGNHAVGVLELHASDQMRNLVERTERRWPIGDRQASIIAGHECSGNDEQKCHRRRKDGKPVMGPVVRYGSGLQKSS